MAQVLAPGVCQAKLAGFIGSHPWVVGVHYNNNSGQVPWTTANMNAIATSIDNYWGSNLAVFFAPSTTLSSVTVTDIGQAAPAAIGFSGTVHAGTGASTQLPPQICTQINYSIPARYRGGHARSMFPGLEASYQTSTEDGWTTAAVNAFQPLIATMLQSAGTAGNGTLCVPTYTYSYVDNPTKKKYVITRTDFKQAYSVGGFTMRPLFGVQRHRGSVGG
jgi:hypothetical protein